jgi:hypothetical protein
MFSTSRRPLAIAAAALIAVVTALAVGFFSPRTACTVRTAPVSADAGPLAALANSAAARSTCERDIFATGPALVALGGVLIASAVGSLLIGAPAGPRGPGRRPQAAAHPAGGPAAATGRPASDDAGRGALVQACIYVRDRLTSRALAERLGAALREAGVEPLEPNGERFDAAHHEAGGTVATNDPAKVGRIAAVEVPGYADRGRPLRAPVVTVYAAGGGARFEQEA